MYGGRDQSSDDENRYPAAEPIGKPHYGGHGRRQGGAMPGQYNFQGGAKRADEEMDIEPMLGGGNQQLNQQEQIAGMKSQKQTTSYTKI